VEVWLDFFSSFIRSPIERIKTWSQIHQCSTLKSTKTLWHRYGLNKGLLFGIRATISREVPQFAVYYPIYEITCKFLEPNNIYNKSNMSHFNIYLAGAASGVGCWILTYPIDIVKTRIQASPPNTYQNLMDCTLKTYQTGGIRVFFLMD